MQIKFKLLTEDAKLPKYETAYAAGFDLAASKAYMIWPGEVQKISTGLAVELPIGTELQIRPRSGLSLKTKVRVANSPGTIDPDYRGEICVLLENIGEFPFAVSKGDRIAQGVVCPVIHASLVLAEDLSETERGAGGFGHTGI